MSTARIKLEIPITLSNVQNHIQNTVTEQFKKHHLSISSEDEDGRKIEEPGCEAYVEINYKLECEDYGSHLIPAVRDFLNALRYPAPLPHHFQPNLVLNSTECFSDHIECAMMQQEVAAVYFGNIQGGVCLSHWEISYIQNSVHIPLSMFVDYEFDLNDLIKVRFKNKETRKNWKDAEDKGTDKKGREQAGYAHYELLVKRNFIRRIIVDPSVNDKFGSKRTRIHFDLNCPVTIRQGFVSDKQSKDNPKIRYNRYLDIRRGRNSKEYPNRLAISDSPIFTIEMGETFSDEDLYVLISRLRARLNISIEFASITVVDCIWGINSPYCKWLNSHIKKKQTDYMKLVATHCTREQTENENESYNYKRHREPKPTDKDAPIFKEFLDNTFVFAEDENLDVEEERRLERMIRKDKFSITFLVECLLSRGAIIKDQLLLDEVYWKAFLDTITKCYVEDRVVCEDSLERVVQMIDERKRLGYIRKAFEKEFRMRHHNRLSYGLSEDEEKQGYQRVRKIIFTPTRVIYVVPETLMSNRVLRSFDEDGKRILRVSFRDDDNSKMRKSKTSEPIIERTVQNAMRLGVCVAGTEFAYLGSSNSQMRDHGAYFMLKATKSDLSLYYTSNNIDGKTKIKLPPLDYIPNIHRVRERLGRFTKMKSIPKMMARLGQCFTQSMEADVGITREQYQYTYDIIGGSDPKNEAYTFSDGVGMISTRFTEQIVKDRKLVGLPSSFQYRLRGMKGMVSLDPYLDEVREWASANNITQLTNIDFLFRPSQIKFDAERKVKDHLEVVKYSAPVPVALNKPFINILDQVSEMQSHECHQRICNRIEELLDKQMRGFAQILVKETECKNKLKELPRRVDIDRLSKAGFSLCNEPFFRSLLKAVVKYSITKSLRKQQIGIPVHLGRSFLGVIDTTGRLQYGQVFVQYSVNAYVKPGKNAKKNILKGTVLLTKNPCVTAGDVRIFEAVDIPELRHMIDVIVFPQYGPRPHPDEMAGSDLDGDEYSVIWDPLMLIERNEPAFDFSSPKRADEIIEKETMDAAMRAFYIKYICQDSVGVIANAFLYQSDLYGINSKVCLNIAKKNSQAVDFTKTGEPPEPLIAAWGKDEQDRDVPPERAERVPDFAVGNDHEPVYVSPRLIGRLFREIKQVEDVLLISEEEDNELNFQPDNLVDYPGWKKYEEKAKVELAKYNTVLRTLMENYGIQSEGEIFSGMISEMRNRISDRDQDDMSLFNTDLIIENKVSIQFKSARENFFQEFGGWKESTEKSEKAYADEDNVLHRSCTRPSDSMKQKATAYYQVCYKEAIRTREKKLSFAWIAYDIIAVVKQEAIQRTESFTPVSNPLEDMLTHFIPKFRDKNKSKFEKFCKFPSDQFDEQSVATLKKYTTCYTGLMEILFLICEWAEKKELLNDDVRYHHICLIFIMYAINFFPSNTGNADKFMDEIGLDVKLDEINVDDVGVLPRSVQMVISFFEFLASRRFRKLENIDFSVMGLDSVFMRGEWTAIHHAGVSVFYCLVFNLKFEELSINDSNEPTLRVVREFEPFVIELPDDIEMVEIKKKLIEKSGVVDLNMRRREGCNRGRVSITCKATREAFYKLRELVAVKPPLNYASRGKEFSTLLSKLVYDKIMS